MTEYTSETTSRVGVTFKRSSTKYGGEGYDIYVGEQADEVEAARVMDLALRLRATALEALKGKSLEQQLEESLR